MALTIENWKNEHKRLQIRYKRCIDPSSEEAKGLLDHLHAVKKIIAEIEVDDFLKKRN